MKISKLEKKSKQLSEVLNGYPKEEQRLILKGMRVPIIYDENLSFPAKTLTDINDDGGYILVNEYSPFVKNNFAQKCKYWLEIGKLNPDSIIDSFDLDKHVIGYKTYGLPVRKKF